jgi:acyl carrier protein
MPDITQRVIDVIAKTQHIPVEGINADSTFEELKIDSLDGINIVFALENEFDISIPDDDLRAFRSIRQVVEGVQKMLEAKQTGSAA